MQRAAAAIGEQGEVARIAAALDGDALDGACHDDGGDGEDAVRQFQQLLAARIAQRRADLFSQRPGRLRHIERHLTALETLRIEPAEQQVGVGDGRLGAATAVTGPGVELALFGPTRRRFCASSQAMEPPPAPTSTMSTTGARIGMPRP